MIIITLQESCIMNKSILAIAVAATMAAPAVMAAPTVYGNLHMSVNDNDSATELDMTSNTSAIGVKGSEDLGDGLKAIYKAEFKMNPETGGLDRRDMFVGLKGGMGTVKIGTMSSNYKQKGGSVDPMYRTVLEARGSVMGTQSSLHSGAGAGGEAGRSTNTVQYTSPKMGGATLVANTTISGAAEETTGFGVRYAVNSDLSVYADTISVGDDSATKFGASYTMGAAKVGVQSESIEDVDYLFLSAAYSMDANNSLLASYGTVDDGTNDGSGLAVAINHKLSKATNVYVGYGDSDTSGSDVSVMTVGIKKKF